MSHDSEIHEFLLNHLNAIQVNDIETYHATTAEDLTLYEWWVTPHRLDGLPFHDFMMENNERRGTVFGVEGLEIDPFDNQPVVTRYDLANLHIQRYGDTAIASYTLLSSSGGSRGVRVAAHNESRVMVRLDGAWKVVHVHKSPAWPAPHIQEA
jgi:ketosteroid isomerase-like protein